MENIMKVYNIATELKKELEKKGYFNISINAEDILEQVNKYGYVVSAKLSNHVFEISIRGYYNTHYDVTMNNRNKFELTGRKIAQIRRNTTCGTYRNMTHYEYFLGLNRKGLNMLLNNLWATVD